MVRGILQFFLVIASISDGKAFPDKFFDERVYQLVGRQMVDGALIGPEYAGQRLSTSGVGRIALSRLAEAAAKAGIPERDVTRAIFEGRFTPDREDLRLATFGFAGGIDDACAAFNKRFGAIGEVGTVPTNIEGQIINRTGKDLLLRLAKRMERFGSAAGLQDAVGFTYESFARTYGNAASLDAILGFFNQRYNVWRYFDLRGGHGLNLRGDYEQLVAMTKPQSTKPAPKSDRTTVAGANNKWWFDASAFRFQASWRAMYIGDFEDVGKIVDFHQLFKIFALVTMERCPASVSAREKIQLRVQPTSGNISTYRAGGRFIGTISNPGSPGRDLPPFEIDARFAEKFYNFSTMMALFVGPRPQYPQHDFNDHFADADLLFDRNSCDSPILKLIGENFLRATSGRQGIAPPEVWSAASVAYLEKAISGTLPRELLADELSESTRFRAGGQTFGFADVKAAYDRLNSALRQKNPNLVSRSPLVFRDDTGQRYVAGIERGTDTIRVFRVPWQEIEAAWQAADAKGASYHERRAVAEALEKKYGGYRFLSDEYAGFGGRLARDARNAVLLSELPRNATP